MQLGPTMAMPAASTPLPRSGRSPRALGPGLVAQPGGDDRPHAVDREHVLDRGPRCGRGRRPSPPSRGRSGSRRCAGSSVTPQASLAGRVDAVEGHARHGHVLRDALRGAVGDAVDRNRDGAEDAVQIGARAAVDQRLPFTLLGSVTTVRAIAFYAIRVDFASSCEYRMQSCPTSSTSASSTHWSPTAAARTCGSPPDLGVSEASVRQRVARLIADGVMEHHRRHQPAQAGVRRRLPARAERRAGRPMEAAGDALAALDEVTYLIACTGPLRLPGRGRLRRQPAPAASSCSVQAWPRCRASRTSESFGYLSVLKESYRTTPAGGDG